MRSKLIFQTNFNQYIWCDLTGKPHFLSKIIIYFFLLKFSTVYVGHWLGISYQSAFHHPIKKQEEIMLIDYQDMMIKFGLFETSHMLMVIYFFNKKEKTRLTH